MLDCIPFTLYTAYYADVKRQSLSDDFKCCVEPRLQGTDVKRRYLVKQAQASSGVSRRGGHPLKLEAVHNPL